MNACIQHSVWLRTVCIPTYRMVVSVKAIAQLQRNANVAITQTQDVVENANVELTGLSVKIRSEILMYY